MDIAFPHRAVVPSLDGDVLVVLAGTTRPLTGREVSRLVRRGTQRGVAQALDRLVLQGIVLRETAAPAFLHTLNRDHIAAPIASLLAGLRTELLTRMRRQIADWPIPAVHVSLFGSAARADGDAESDVDLFIVRPLHVGEDNDAWRTQLENLADAVGAWTGNDAGLSESDPDSVQELVEAGAPVIDELRESGIDLAGVPLRKLLKGRA